MASDPYTLAEVLSVAKVHPFYESTVKYPPNVQSVRKLQEQAKGGAESVNLESQGLLRKKDLYQAIERLVNDTSPHNTYRISCYTSITGGGSGGTPLFFATDVHENRRHRAHFGKFLAATGVVEETDWILTTHFAGNLYRSLDLMAELFENGGASVLCGGSYMSTASVAQALADYHVNVLAGDSSQIVNTVDYISSLPREERDRIRITKVVYTSEMLTPAQRSFITEVLVDVKIYSIYGSSEAGPWAISSPDLKDSQGPESSQDFVFDTRSMVVEILDPEILENEITTSGLTPIPDGESGIIVQTSLHRLRNPLVRYVTGDIGSIHPLPGHSRSKMPEADRDFLRVLRLYGRDRKFSFEWDGMYFEFANLTALMGREDCGVLQWQVILDRLESSPLSTVEIRVFRPSQTSSMISEDALTKRIMTFFNAFSGNIERLSVTFVKDKKDFVRSGTGNKVMKFVDRFNN